MNLYLIKKVLKKREGHYAEIKYNLGRNKYEIYKGILEKTYPNIFTFIDENNRLRSFSYNDVIMKQLKIDFKK